MKVEDLDMDTRSKLYNHTRKIIRKYQKGITTGKLTADSFVDNILSDESINSILSEEILNEENFKLSYKDYISTLINMQNESLSNSKRKNKPPVEKPNVTQTIHLKNLLASSGYTLSIPYQYLNSFEVDSISKYITTGSIDIGNEKIYNYIHKTNLN